MLVNLLCKTIQTASYINNEMTVIISPNIKISNSRLSDFRRLSFTREVAFRSNVTLGHVVNYSKFYLPFLPAVYTKLCSYVGGERLRIVTSSGKENERRKWKFEFRFSI